MQNHGADALDTTIQKHASRIDEDRKKKQKSTRSEFRDIQRIEAELAALEKGE